MNFFKKQGRYLILISIGFLLNLDLSAQLWQFNEVGVGTKPAIALDGNNIPHVAYMLEASPGFVKHAEWQTDTFISTTIQEAYYYGPLDIAVNKFNQPGISVHHHDLPDEIVFLRNEMNEWSIEPVVSSGHDGWDNSITFDSQGYPHTSSVDPANFGSSNGIEYAWKDAQGWHKEVIGSVPVRYQFSTSIALDREDNPHIVYYAEDTLYYAKQTAGIWEIENLGSENGRFPSLALDSMNRPHIAYYMRVMNDQGIIRYASKQGGGWNAQTVETLTNVPISFTGARRVTAIQVDQKQHIHICFGDRNVVKYGVLEGDEWQLYDIVDESETSIVLGAQIDLDISNEDIPQPHITYFEATSLSPLRGIIKHVTLADVDGDGYNAFVDCDDNDSEVNPGTEEIPDNGKDDNCDGEEANTSTSLRHLGGQLIKIFPNPVNDVLNIDSSDNGIYTVSIYSILGQLVKREEFNTQDKLDVSQLEKGVYLLEIKDRSENELIIEKIIKL